jgi:hypothetical protein
MMPGIISTVFLVGFERLQLQTILRTGEAHPLLLILLGLTVVGAVIIAFGLVAYVIVGSRLR